MRAQKLGDAQRVDRAGRTDPLEPLRGAADEGHVETIGIEVAVEPDERVGSLARVVGPAGRDDADAPTVERLPARRREEDRRVDGVRDHDRVGQLVPELAMALEAVPRLEDGRVRELPVQLGDPRIGAVVEAAVDPDRPVDAMHHPAVGAREAPQAREVEVERVEEARARPPGHAVGLDLETARAELTEKRSQELVPASRRRRLELMEEGEIGTSATRRDPDGGCTDAADGARGHAAAPRRFHASNPGCSSSTFS